ncbi:hypothetical protein SESBI_31561 [Sesbania bispinosa]|nr:hypothetical protein SESBI_31561 [Sesbania bispinosa]
MVAWCVRLEGSDGAVCLGFCSTAAWKLGAQRIRATKTAGGGRTCAVVGTARRGATKALGKPFEMILPWLFKGTHEQDRVSITSSPSTIKDKNAKGKDIIILKHNRAYGRSRRRIEGSKKLRLFTFICGKDIPKTCFYRTLHFGNMDNTRDFIHSVKIKREELSGRVGIVTKKLVIERGANLEAKDGWCNSFT